MHIAGSHLRDSSSGEYNLPVVQRLFPKRGVKSGHIRDLGAGVGPAARQPEKHSRRGGPCAQSDVRLMNREKGAGSRDLLDQQLREAGVAHSKVNGYGPDRGWAPARSSGGGESG